MDGYGSGDAGCSAATTPATCPEACYWCVERALCAGSVLACELPTRSGGGWLGSLLLLGGAVGLMAASIHWPRVSRLLPRGPRPEPPSPRFDGRYQSAASDELHEARCGLGEVMRRSAAGGEPPKSPESARLLSD